MLFQVVVVVVIWFTYSSCKSEYSCWYLEPFLCHRVD